ncbi:exosome complex component RRP46 [Cimex lectularius]|uniref:Exoribonuclease phosphorolytic domain-containing protein n=1 Tax=Cimex lectularius TaxID=79782 RepID=A0A8I6RLV0_CIMLE|nr:exosome complex component RRP46 [Cimex lectularius]
MESVETMEVAEKNCSKSSNGNSVKFEINVLNKAEGSAILSMGKNVVLTALYGPYELKHLRVQDDLAFQVNYRTKAWSQGNNFKSIEDLIKSACESIFYPRPFSRHESTLLVQELQDDNSILCCAVNASCLAIMATGMEMQHLVTAGCCCIDEKGDMVLDPDGETIKKSKFVMTAAFECINYNIVMINSEGSCSPKEFNAATEMCKSGAKEMVKWFKAAIMKYSKVL